MDSKETNFFCGACKKKLYYSVKDVVRCTNCGNRTLFKQRTKNYIEYSTN